MSNIVKLYPFGYTFSDKSLSHLPTHYEQIQINGKYYYSYDKDFKGFIKTEDEKFVLIHGEFVHVGIDNQYTESGLARHLLNSYYKDYDEFLDTLDFIAGRYVIIIGNKEEVELYPDATNSRTSYYSSQENIIASHVFLIRDQFHHERIEHFSKVPEITNALNFTPFKNIESIIPNYKLNFYDKKMERYFPRKENIYTDMEEKEKFDLFERFWFKQLDHFFDKYNNFIFSLSGGGDSRFSLALLKNYLKNVDFFTYTTIDGEDRSSEAAKSLTIDYKIVQQMLSDINLNHQYIYYVENRKELSPIEQKVLSKNTIGRHSSFLIPYVREMFPKPNLKHIRGNLLEIGQARYYRNGYKDSNITESKIMFDKRHKKGLGDQVKEEVDEIFERFVKKTSYGKNIYNYHILDLHYWELRMGRWHSEILNTHDIAFDTISPFNHRAMIDISLSFPYEKRRDEYLFQELINRNYPILNFYGDNNILNLYEQNRNIKYK